MTTDDRNTHDLHRLAPPGQNPFRVPEGYFHTVHSRIMSRIKQQEEEKKKEEKEEKKENPSPRFSLLARLRSPWARLAIAAVFTGCAFVAGTAFFHNTDSTAPSPATNISSTQEIEYTDEILDYIMLSNSEIEYYLTMSD